MYEKGFALTHSEASLPVQTRNLKYAEITWQFRIVKIFHVSSRAVISSALSGFLHVRARATQAGCSLTRQSCRYFRAGTRRVPFAEPL